MPRFSANLGFLWPDRPLLERIAAAASAGFKAVELHWPYDVPAEQVREACGRHGVELLGINTPVGDAAKGEFGLGAVPGRQEDFAQGFRQALEYARRSGASSIHVMAGVVEPPDRRRAMQVFAENLTMAAAEAPDLTLLLEPINPRDKPGYFYSTIADAAALIESVGADNVRLMFDVYHVGVGEGDIIKRLERYLPITGHVQIAAVPSRAEPDEGEIAYDRVIAALDGLGYSGLVGLEYKPRGDTDAGLAWIEAFGLSLKRGA